MVGYRIKKIVMLLILGLVPGLLYPWIVVFSGFWMGTMIYVALALLIVLITLRMLHHPLLAMIERKGMLAGTIDSSGKVDLFNVQYNNPPLVEGKYNGKKMDTVFDRSLVYDLQLHSDDAVLQEAKVVDSKGKVKGKKKVLVLPEKSDNVFAFENRFPFFIYNKNLDVFLSKEVFSSLEKTAFTKHLVLDLLRKTAELSSYMRDFGRYVVEATKPRRRFLEVIKKWWFWVIIIIIIMAVSVLLFPAIGNLFSSIKGTMT